MPPEKQAEEAVDVFAGAEPDDDEVVEGDRGDMAEEPSPEPSPAESEQPAEGEQEQEEPEPAEPEASDEPDEGEEKPEEKPQRQPRIPKDRFDQVNERRKLAEQRAQQLEERLKQLEGKAEGDSGEPFDFAAKEQEYMEAVVDGEFEKAKTIREEIRTAERAEIRQQLQATERTATDRTKAQLEFDQAVATYQGKFAEFDPQSDAYDEALTQEVVEMRDGFLSTGNYTPAQALEKAAKTVAKVYDLTDRTVGAPELEPQPKPAAPKKPDVREKAKAANAQPPSMDQGTPSNEPTVSIDDMTEEEFDALPESAKARLRGDIL